jgi:hypothetical protein
MARWEQVGGDVNPKDYGAILARDDGGGWIEIWEIETEGDLNEGEFYVVESSHHKSDLGWEKNQDVARTVGATKEEWEQQSDVGRASERHRHHGGDGRTVKGWARALPAASNSIKWWKR